MLLPIHSSTICAECFGRGSRYYVVIDQRKHMRTPDYIKILKLDKIAMDSKTRRDFISAVKPRLQYARNLGIEGSFLFFVERAWGIFGDGT